MTSTRPLYQQVRESIRTQIASGLLPVGELLPTEEELTRVFNVSRATVRAAIRDLASEGLVKPRPKVGTLVIRARAPRRESTLRGLTEHLQEQGIVSEAVVLDVAVLAPPPHARDHLQLGPHDRVLRLVRQRRIAGRPFALIVSYVPESIGIQADEDFTVPLYQLIERSHRMHITHGRDVVGARGARPDEADALGLEVGAPTLTIRRTAYLDHDRPVEYVEAAIRPDLYEYTVTLPR